MSKATTPEIAPFCRDIPKNAREVLRVQRTTYKGHELIDLRVWYPSDTNGGELRPSPKGVAIRVELLGAVLAALKGVARDVEACGERHQS